MVYTNITMGQCSIAESMWLRVEGPQGTPAPFSEAVGSLVTQCLPASQGDMDLTGSFSFIFLMFFPPLMEFLIFLLFYTYIYLFIHLI